MRLALAPVKALFSTAFEEGVRSNPCLGVRLARPTDPLEEEHARTLTSDELDALVEATPEMWQLLIVLLEQTGLRISEALALTWADVDLGKQRLLVRRRVYRGRVAAPKSRYGRRSVPLSPRLCRDLWAQRKETGGADGALLFASQTGSHLNPANLHGRWLKKAARAAGVEWAGFHTLRHTCATNLFHAGLNAKQVQVWLGHHSPAFTLATYVHLLSDDLPASPFGSEGANQVGTRPAETVRGDQAVEVAETAV